MSQPADGVLDALRRLPVDELMLPVLVQLAIVIAAARVGAVVARWFGQPGVVGEILAGLALGPSLLGWLLPGAFAWLFRPDVHGLSPEANAAFGAVLLPKVFAVLAQIGLVLLLFLVGLEFDFGHLRSRGGSALAISVSGVLLPFALGAGLAVLIHARLEPHQETGRPVDLLGFVLFLGVAMSITAIPVLGRIMQELNITRTGLGAVTIAAAAFNDAAGWTLLAAVAGTVRGGFDPWRTAGIVAGLAAFAAFMLVVARPLLHRWATWELRRGEGELSLTGLTVLLVLLLASGTVTNLLGIGAIFGAFLFGAVLSGHRPLAEAVRYRLTDVVTGFFLPVYFTFTGLRTSVDALDSPWLWGLGGLIVLAAMLGKLGGCFLAARLTGYGTRESAAIGAMMNARGLMELIVINIGYDLGVVPRSAYCMLVLMAVVTTVMTTPLVLSLARGTELEPAIRATPFGRWWGEPETKPREQGVGVAEGRTGDRGSG